MALVMVEGLKSLTNGLSLGLRPPINDFNQRILENNFCYINIALTSQINQCNLQDYQHASMPGIVPPHPAYFHH